VARLETLLRAEVAGVPIRVRGDDPRPARPFLDRFARLARTRRRPVVWWDLLLRPRRPRVVRLGRSWYATRRVADLLDATELDLYRQVTWYSPRVPVHAACLAAPGGAAVLLAGPSGVGKSSLARALVERRWRYLGDDQAFVAADGTASGLPRAIAPDGVDPVLPAPAQVAHGPRPVGLVVLLGRPRRPSAAPVPTPAAVAAAELASGVLRGPRPEDLGVLTAFAGRTRAVRLGCAGVDAAADAVEATLARGTAREIA